MKINHSDVLNFWFREIEPKSHWVKDPVFDQLIQKKFGEIHKAAAACELSNWRETGHGRLAEIIVLDQFSRNMFRDRPEAFAYDALALALSQEALRNGAERELSDGEKSFLIMPFMHSESAEIHKLAVPLFEKHGKGSLEFELKHKAIIDKFGRYPHRNKILGRDSTPDEIDFLKQPGSSF